MSVRDDGMVPGFSVDGGEFGDFFVALGSGLHERHVTALGEHDEPVAGQHHLAVVLSEMQGRRTPGRGWIEGVLARRPTGVIAVFSDLSAEMREQLTTRDIPFFVVDPTGEPLHDTLVDKIFPRQATVVSAEHFIGAISRGDAPVAESS